MGVFSAHSTRHITTLTAKRKCIDIDLNGIVQDAQPVPRPLQPSIIGRWIKQERLPLQSFQTPNSS
ncbi:hypothetical protein ABEB36_004362 [Hypothenemus hampei]|uniref:Uncharacterized protein n=1 Tax=Hypothenemus hampei TaxID=57062 RepID=A0ABD1F333_HYPHA